MALVVFVPIGGWWVADRYGLWGVLPQVWWALLPHIVAVVVPCQTHERFVVVRFV